MINTVINGCALEVLRTMESDSVDCCISSPPYYGLRDYGVEGQLGLEKTFQEYLSKLIEIYAEVKRVIKPTGTIWVNLGDSYSGSLNGKGDKTTTNRNKPESYKQMYKGQNVGKQIQDKCLLNIPSRFAIKMTDELNLIQRNEIIWYKRNCMPSSVKDRFTVDFEKIYLFVKNKKYYFEQILEPIKQVSIDRLARAVSNKNKWVNGADGQTPHNLPKPRENKNYKGGQNKGRENNCAVSTYKFEGGDYLVTPGNPNGRNKRCVWDITTKPYKEAHFATFPEDLVKPMIQAGSPKDGIVLDIFAGSGTTLKVAKEMGRNYIRIELNPEYIPLIQKRLDSVSEELKFASVITGGRSQAGA